MVNCLFYCSILIQYIKVTAVLLTGWIYWLDQISESAFLPQPRQTAFTKPNKLQLITDLFIYLFYLVLSSLDNVVHKHPRRVTVAQN